MGWDHELQSEIARTGMSEQDWIEWIERHQVLAGLMQLGIYVLCIAGFLLFWGCIVVIVGTLFG